MKKLELKQRRFAPRMASTASRMTGCRTSRSSHVKTRWALCRSSPRNGPPWRRSTPSRRSRTSRASAAESTRIGKAKPSRSYAATAEDERRVPMTSALEPEHVVVLADPLADLQRHLAATLGPLHPAVVHLERLDRLDDVGRVTADADPVADLEGALAEVDGRDTDLRVVVRDGADLLFRGHARPPGWRLLQGARRQAGDVVVEEEDVQNHDRDRAEDGARHEGAPEVDVATDQLGRNPDARRDLLRGRGEGECVDELVPGEREGEERRADEPRHGHRQHDAPERLDARGPVHQGALLDLLRHRAEVTDQQPRAERDEERRVRQDERDRKSTRLNSSHTVISYAVFCLKKKKKPDEHGQPPSEKFRNTILNK